MENLTSLRLELNIAGQKMIQQIQIYNQQIDAEVSKGIELAVEEILKDGDFALRVKEQTIKAINSIATEAVMKWEVRSAISKKIEEKVGEKITEYADRIAQKIVKDLE